MSLRSLINKLLRPHGRSFLILLSLLGSACSVDSAKNHYVLGEKLWSDRKYSAAVSEFEKVIAKDPRGKLGMQATYRAAMTQYLFLGEYGNAIRKFRNYAEISTDPASVWDSQLQIGDILFSATDQYDQSVLHYRSLLKQKPEATQAAEFLFRIGKSQFFMFQFAEAIETFQELIKKYAASNSSASAIWAEKAAFEIGSTYFTRGEQHTERKGPGTTDYQAAIQAYEKFIKTYPKSDLVQEARFGVASCLEELNQLDDAYAAYTALKGHYPSPNVIEIKLIRIRQRIAQRNR
ncbi:MAG: tetratricopeptide repeat protein [Bdellovibrionia bacterium]